MRKKKEERKYKKKSKKGRIKKLSKRNKKKKNFGKGKLPIIPIITNNNFFNIYYKIILINFN